MTLSANRGRACLTGKLDKSSAFSGFAALARRGSYLVTRAFDASLCMVLFSTGTRATAEKRLCGSSRRFPEKSEPDVTVEKCWVPSQQSTVTLDQVLMFQMASSGKLPQG